MTRHPIVSVDEQTRVRHVPRPERLGGPRVIVTCREVCWGDARPRLVSHSHYFDRADP